MQLDECTPYPATHEVAKKSLERSIRWGQRCRDARTKMDLKPIWYRSRRCL